MICRVHRRAVTKTWSNASPKKTKKMRILLLDNYDSFTYNLYDYIAQTGAICTVIRNDAPNLPLYLREKWDGVVLSPGPKTPQDAGFLMDAVGFFVQKNTPLLGVCLGHQAIGQYFGAQLVAAPLPRHGKTSRIIHNNQGIFEGIPQATEVMRYHSLVLQNIKNPLIITARSTDDHCVMGVRHQVQPIIGVQFHPESILTQAGLAMIHQWVTTLTVAGTVA
jgi:anthranilate synthase/aminodeoxychorismate synthase-like glutamine amidotransferase